MKQSKFNGKFKALMVDVDGTLVKLERDALPTARVSRAIKKAHKKIKIGLATSRPFNDSIHLIESLQIDSPCILSGGPQIYDPVSKEFIWEKPMDNEDVEMLSQKLSDLKIKFHYNNGFKDISHTRKMPEKTFHFWVQGIYKEKIGEVQKFISHIPTISMLMTSSWKPGLVDLIISHSSATKQHGIMEVAKILKISTKEIIGVGDSYNDFPLFMACGYKVAMGNAVPDLKEIADYIAPPVDKDGLAHVIENFIL